jgi:hypothetical protein
MTYRDLKYKVIIIIIITIIIIIINIRDQSDRMWQ